MIKQSVVKDLEELLNGSIDPSLFPFKKGNSIRIGSFIVRSNKNGSYKVFDCQENKLIAEMFCKTSAVALAKTLAKGQMHTKKILDLDHEIQKWYNDCLFYKHTLNKSKDPIKLNIIQTRYDIAKHKTANIRSQLDRYIYS